MSNLAVSGRWLRHIKDGTIYPYSKAMVGNPLVQEVPEELAFPERFVPEKQKGRVSVVSLDTPAPQLELVLPAKETAPELAADAGRGLNKGKGKGK